MRGAECLYGCGLWNSQDTSRTDQSMRASGKLKPIVPGWLILQSATYNPSSSQMKAEAQLWSQSFVQEQNR